MNLTWMLLILAVALIALGALRLDVITARWRELTTRRPGPGEVGGLDAPAPRPGTHAGLHPHSAPVARPGFHRSGRRH